MQYQDAPCSESAAIDNGEPSIVPDFEEAKQAQLLERASLAKKAPISGRISADGKLQAHFQRLRPVDRGIVKLRVSDFVKDDSERDQKSEHADACGGSVIRAILQKTESRAGDGRHKREQLEPDIREHGELLYRLVVETQVLHREVWSVFAWVHVGLRSQVFFHEHGAIS